MAVAALLATYARMAVALFLSILIAYALGFAMYKSRVVESALLPALDVLQSVPILGFFPVALYVFIHYVPYVGVELAAIFLIITSMLWNLVFGVYQTLKTVPRELLDMASVYLDERLKFVHVLLPSTLSSVYYNAAVSWANAFFFVTASEVITLGTETRLFGIGSLVVTAFQEGRYDVAYVGIAVGLAGNLLMYGTLWRWLTKKLPELPASNLLYHWSRWGSYVVYAASALAVAVFVQYLLSSITSIHVFLGGVTESALSAVLSLLRVAALLVICVAAGVVATSLVVEKPSLERGVFLVVAAISSTPPVFLFPLLAAYIRGELLAILLLLPASVVYSVFNALAAWRSVPRDMARAYHIAGAPYLLNVLIPAVSPYLVTGALTAWGGAWNGLVVAEPLAEVNGIGTYMTKAAEAGDMNKLIASVIVMTAIVVLVNRFVWRKLYEKVAQWV
ncbi:MAG: ABC transporter permease subunit [Pyrobaculum sp.]